MGNKFLEAVQPNIDKFGIIAQLDGSQGDSILHEADLVFAAYCTPAVWNSTIENQVEEVTEVKKRFKSIIPQLVILDKSHAPSYGLFRRGNDLTKWSSHFDRGSRDQMHSIVAMAMAAPEAFDAVMSNWRRRCYLFTTNTLGNGEYDVTRKLPDFTGPAFWSYAIRCTAIRKGASVKWLRPLLALFDIEMLINSLIRVYWYGKDRNETDSRNHIKQLGLSKLIGDTWTAQLSRAIYRRMPIKFSERLEAKAELDADGAPVVILNIDYATGAQQELDDYFNSNGGVSGLAELYKPVVKWILS